MIKRIMDGETLIAIVGTLEDAKWGNNFATENELPMQLGILRMNKGEIQSHIHKIRNRQFKSISNECHVVIRGKVIIRLYNFEKKLVSTQMLCPNTFCALYNGGHGFEVIKDDTIMLEVKCSNFTSTSDDKDKFGQE
jgi:hypothetical protein